MPDIRVEHRPNHSREVSIYDRFGSSGHISLTIEEAEFVKDRLEELVDDV
jgi:hypothetical protein